VRVAAALRRVVRLQPLRRERVLTRQQRLARVLLRRGGGAPLLAAHALVRHLQQHTLGARLRRAPPLQRVHGALLRREPPQHRQRASVRRVRRRRRRQRRLERRLPPQQLLRRAHPVHEDVVVIEHRVVAHVHGLAPHGVDAHELARDGVNHVRHDARRVRARQPQVPPPGQRVVRHGVVAQRQRLHEQQRLGGVARLHVQVVRRRRRRRR
jgi:hypothetical protein